MSSRESSPAGRNGKAGAPEKLARLYRNWNALGAVALGGLAVVAPVGNVLWAGLAAVNAAQAGVGEVWLRTAKKSRQKKPKT